MNLRKIIKEEIGDFGWITDTPITRELGKLVDNKEIKVGDTLVLTGQVYREMDESTKHFSEFTVEVTDINEPSRMKDDFSSIGVEVTCDNEELLDFIQVSTNTFDLIEKDRELMVILHIRNGEVLNEDFDWINDNTSNLVYQIDKLLEGSPFFVKLSTDGRVIEINRLGSSGTDSTLVDYLKDDIDSGKVTLDTIIQELSDIVDELGFRSTKGKIYQELHDYLVGFYK